MRTLSHVFFLDPSPVRRVPIQTGIQRKLNFVSVRTIKGSSSQCRRQAGREVTAVEPQFARTVTGANSESRVAKVGGIDSGFIRPCNYSVKSVHMNHQSQTSSSSDCAEQSTTNTPSTSSSIDSNCGAILRGAATTLHTRQYHENLGRPWHRDVYRCRQIRGDYILIAFVLLSHIFLYGESE